MTPGQPAQSALLLVGLLVVVLVALAILAGHQLRIPEVHVADAARSVFAWTAGVVVLAGGGFTVLASIVRFRIVSAIIGIVAVLVALTLVGITVGVPAVLEPIVD